MIDAQDYRYMARALVLARRGLFTTDPNPRVGCVIVKDGAIVGEGWHICAGEAHAEVIALEVAGRNARGATAYITLEPCCHYGRTPPCTSAMLAAGIGRAVIAMEDPNPKVTGRGLAQLRAAGVTVECGVMEAEARALNPGFVLRMREQRPFIRCKLAMSLDGRTAMASGESQWITSAAARRDVQFMRARASAIMTGAATVLADDPRLNVRFADIDRIRQPLRVILDPELMTPPAARIFAETGQVLIFTAVTDESCYLPLCSVGAKIQAVARHGEGLNLLTVMTELAHREVNEVHLECGATLAGAMLQAGLMDEMVIYLAPRLMGDSARGLFHLPGLTQMSESIALHIEDIRAVGVDWRITIQPASLPAVASPLGRLQRI
jgi:diaminohydroxyphosphoribosylaminopyrimidine deaminase/5-amino-6-(5-phosphoribosylamino)uracil reductase